MLNSSWERRDIKRRRAINKVRRKSNRKALWVLEEVLRRKAKDKFDDASSHAAASEADGYERA